MKLTALAASEPGPADRLRNVLDRALTPRPRDVAGYQEARAGGMTPAMPAQPPSPLPGSSAHRLLLRLGYTLAAGFGAVLVALAALPTEDEQIGVAGAAVLILVMAAGAFMGRRALVSFRSKLLDEIQAGYTSTTFQQGGFWLAHRDGSVLAPGRNVLGWDWRGLWVLDASGAVVSSPDRALDAPGLYPSPHRPGQRELWTGHQWSFVYPDHSGRSRS